AVRPGSASSGSGPAAPHAAARPSPDSPDGWCVSRSGWSRSLSSSGSEHHPAVVDHEVEAIDGRILEKESRAIDDILHRREFLGDGLRGMTLEDGRRLAVPVRAVPGDAGMDRIDPD